jgi:hypothetical protein
MMKTRITLRGRLAIAFAVLSLAFLGVACRSTNQAQVETAPAPDPDAITYANLYEHEADWPYQIQLTKNWKPEGWEGRFGFGMGVLVRVEPSGLLRIDFASLGKYQVPADETNVLDEANKIRSGERIKTRPNFVVAVGTRLLDPKVDPPEPVSRERTETARAYLLVFVDPESPAFREIARDLAADLESSEGAMAVLVPQGGLRDGGVLNACRAAGWTAPFLLDHFAKPLTESMLGDMPDSPQVMLVTPEGRLLFSQAWNQDVIDDLERALERGPRAARTSRSGGEGDHSFVAIP